MGADSPTFRRPWIVKSPGIFLIFPADPVNVSRGQSAAAGVADFSLSLLGCCGLGYSLPGPAVVGWVAGVLCKDPNCVAWHGSAGRDAFT